MANKSNPVIVNTLLFLRKQKVPFWTEVAGIISKPKRKFVIVNLSKISKYSKDGETIIVPGKILGEGELSHKITLAAVSASEEAKKKVKIHSIEDMVKKHPKGEGLKIIM